MTVKIDGTNTVANPAFTGADTDTGLQCGTDELKLVTGGTARATVDSSGRLLAGTTTARTNVYSSALNITPQNQFESNFTNYQGGLSLINNSASGHSPVLTFGQSYTKTLGGNGLTPNGEPLGIINFTANDGTNFRTAATIQAFADGTTGSGDVPGRLAFYTTADGAATPTEKMRILSSGGLTFNGDTAQANALDDYEEGTWTPTAAGGHTGITVDTNNCVYIKVGKMVTLHFEIYYPTGLSGSTFKTGGVPFQIDEEATGTVMLNSVDFPTNRTMVTLYGNNSELRLYASGNGQNWQDLHGNDVTTDASILGTITYRST
mgnify:CR=1 FL=1